MCFVKGYTMADIIVSRGKSSNARYLRVETDIRVALPQQAADVYAATSDEPQSVEEIAANLVTKTKQSNERIVRYYLPRLISEQLIIKA